MIDPRIRVRTEIAVIVVLAATTIAVGWFHPYAWQRSMALQFTFDGSKLAPAVMWAAGYKMSSPVDFSLPGLSEFLTGNDDSLDTSGWPGEIVQSGTDFFYDRHFVLFSLIALTWKVFGISWGALKIPVLIGFALSALAIYGITRLYAGRILSLGVAMVWVLTPGVLATLWMYRDFSKAPFLLGAMFLMAFVIRRPLSARALTWAAVATGCVIGFGANLRQDLLICVPVALLIYLFGLKTGGLGLKRRLTLCAILLASYFVCALPYNLVEVGAGTEIWHHFLMGTSKSVVEELPIHPADFEIKPLYSDDYAMGVALRYEEAVENRNDNFGWANKQASRGQRNYVLFLLRNFPADFLLRAYASCLWVLQGAMPRIGAFLNPSIEGYDPSADWHARLMWPMHFLGPAIAVLLLYACALRSPKEAFISGLVLLYFCSYISIQFGYRHAFHLAFIPALLVACALQLIVTGLKEQAWKTAWGKTSSLRHAAAVALLLAGALLLFGSLTLARAWQTSQVEALATQLRDLPRRELEIEAKQFQSFTLLAPRGMVDGRRRSHYLSEQRAGDTYYRMQSFEMLVAAFEPGNEPLTCHLVYESTSFLADYTSSHTIPVQGNTATVLYFPVYERESRMSRFAGIVVPDFQARRLRGVWRLAAEHSPASVLYMQMPENGPPVRTFSTIGESSAHGHGSVLGLWRGVMWRSGALIESGQWEALNAALTQVMEIEVALPGTLFLRARALAEIGEIDAALSDLAHSLREDPSFGPFLTLADSILSEQPALAAEFWRSLAGESPSIEVVERFLRSLAVTDGEEAALAESVSMYAHALAYRPWDPFAAARLHAAGHMAGDDWRAAIPDIDDVYPSYLAAMAAGHDAMPEPLVRLDARNYRQTLFYLLDAAVKEMAEVLAVRILHDLEAWGAGGMPPANEIVDDLLREYEERDLPTLHARLETLLAQREMATSD